MLTIAKTVKDTMAQINESQEIISVNFSTRLNCLGKEALSKAICISMTLAEYNSVLETMLIKNKTNAEKTNIWYLGSSNTLVTIVKISKIEPVDIVVRCRM